MHTDKCDNAPTFPERKLDGSYKDEMGSDLYAHIEGTRIKNHMDPAIYEKKGIVLRIKAAFNIIISTMDQHRQNGIRDPSNMLP